MELEEKIKSYWGKAADRYSQSIENELSNFKRAAWKKQILDNAPKADGKLRILDIGTGPGFFPIIMAEEGHEATGIDLTESMLQCARENAAREGVKAAFWQMNASELNFSDNHFDLIICRNLTWNLAQPEKAYREWLRVLRPGGRLLIFDANWNLHLYNQELKAKLDANEKKVKELFGKTIHEDADMEESDIISRQLPLGDRIRPQWDLEMMISLGFKKVFAELDISEQTYDEREKASYDVIQPFMVGGEK